MSLAEMGGGNNENEKPQTSGSTHITFLASIYEQVLARDGVLTSLIFNMLGIGATALGGIIFTVRDYSPGSGRELQNNEWIYLALPLAPTILLGLLAFLAFQVNFLAQYSHAIESHMAGLAGGRLDTVDLRVRTLSVDMPSFMRLSSRIFGAGRSSYTRTYRSSLLVIVIAVGTLLLSVPIIKLRDLPLNFKYAAAVIYLPTNILMLVALLRSWRPNRGLLRDTLLDVLGEPTKVKRPGRRLGSYLVAPRTVDHAFKILVAIFGVLLGRLYISPNNLEPFWSKGTLGTVILVVVVLEYLIYQGRYTWNDLRDLPIDVRHTHAAERRRIPVPLSPNELRAIWLSIPIKAILAVVIVNKFAPQHLGRFLWVALGIWMSALIYDGLRQRSRNRLRPSKSPVGEPTRPMSSASIFDRASCRLSMAVCVFVGAGYALRMIVALEIGSAGRIPLGLCLLFAATMWCSEVATVTISFALEGDESLRGRSRPSSNSCPAFPGMYESDLREKAHLCYLMVQAGLLDKGAIEASIVLLDQQGRGMETTEVYCISCHAVKCNCCKEAIPILANASIISVWSLAGSLGFLLASYASISASNGMAIPRVGVLWVPAVVAIPAVIQCMVARTRFLGFIVSSTFLGLVAVWQDLAYPLLGSFLFLILSIIYYQMLTGNYQLVVGWFDDVKVILGKGLHVVGRLIENCRHWLTGGWDPDDLIGIVVLPIPPHPDDPLVHRVFRESE